MKQTAVICFLVGAVALTMAPMMANAHAGHFHICPDTPTGRNYVRFEIGNSTTFTSLNATLNFTMTGKVTAWMYAYNNCTSSLSSALELDTILYQNGAAVSVNTTGTAHSGSCSSIGAQYLHNATLGATGGNRIFWNPTLTTANGTLCGNAANSWIMRGVDPAGQLEADPLQVMVVRAQVDGVMVPVLCSELALYPKRPVADLTALAKVCPSPPPPPPPPAPSPAPSPPVRAPSPPPPNGSGAAARVSAMALVGAALLAVFSAVF